MPTVRWLLLVCAMLLGSGVAFDVWRRPSGSAAATVSSPARTIPNDTPTIWTGSPSCVGRSCHGGLEPRTDGVCLQNEYTTIATLDPHARAYQVLFERRSQDMVRALGRADGKAHEEARCLACHATPLAVAQEADAPTAVWGGRRQTPTPAIRDAEVAFGVGCESCHGPAAGWLDRHYVKGWKTATIATGDWNPASLESSSVRAATCAGCHVGSPASTLNGRREVDHDLLAAGHPRLLFEFVSLQDAQPPHWKAKARDASYDWFVGQIEGARAALRLVREQATTKSHAWPELAQYDCFACHHDLRSKSWRQETPTQPGKLRWDSWNDAVIVRLLADANLPSESWRKLRDAMMSFADRDAVLARLPAAERSLEQLGALADQWKQTSGGARRLANFLNPEWATAGSWEEAEQYFFALRALKSDDPDLARRLANLEAKRGFESGYVSPRRFDPREFFRK